MPVIPLRKTVVGNTAYTPTVTPLPVPPVPPSPEVLLVMDMANKLWRFSSDTAIWTQVYDASAYLLTDISVSKANSSIVVIHDLDQYGGGIADIGGSVPFTYSLNAGLTWVLKLCDLTVIGLINALIGVLYPDPSNSNRVWAQVYSATFVLYDTWSIIYTNDFGNNWTIAFQIVFPGTPGFGGVCPADTTPGLGDIAISNDGLTIYASVTPNAPSLFPANTSEFRVYRSQDGGVTWSLVDNVIAANNYANPFPTCLMINPTFEPHVMFYANYPGTLRETGDAGNTWNPVQIASFGKIVANLSGEIITNNIATAFEARRNLGFAINDNSNFDGNGCNTNGFFVCTSYLYNFFAFDDEISNQRIYKSTDGGVTWTLYNVPDITPAVQFFSIAALQVA